MLFCFATQILDNLLHLLLGPTLSVEPYAKAVQMADNISDDLLNRVLGDDFNGAPLHDFFQVCATSRKKGQGECRIDLWVSGFRHQTPTIGGIRALFLVSG